MMTPRTVQDVIRQQVRRNGGQLPAPEYKENTYEQGETTKGSIEVRLGLSPACQARHMTDESNQIFTGLESTSYILAGSGQREQEVDLLKLVDRYDPATVVLQDKREWMGETADKSRDPAMRFQNVTALKARNDIFKLTILKDAQNNNAYHRESADEIGCHAWIVYYHPRVVAHLAPFVRPRHLVRTYHTLDPALVPEYAADGRAGCILSGALGEAYPLRTRLVREHRRLPQCTWHQHPGYHRRGCETPRYLQRLSQFKVAICTSSRYGYALRKLMEATAAGCVVLTDLPTDETLPEIDDNLVRVHPDEPTAMIAERLRQLIPSYDPDRQREMARRACEFYDYRAEGRRLADRIEYLRRNYDGP